MSILSSLFGYDDGNAAAGNAAAAKLQAADNLQGGLNLGNSIASQGILTNTMNLDQINANFAQSSKDSAPSTIITGAAGQSGFLGGLTEFVTDPNQAAKDISSQSGALSSGFFGWLGTITGGLLNGLGNGIFSGLFAFIKQIPWWVWLIVAFALFWFLGGNRLLEKKARRIFA